MFFFFMIIINEVDLHPDATSSVEVSTYPWSWYSLM